MKNQKGAVSFPTLLLISFIIFLLGHSYNKLKLDYEAMLDRSSTYLCMGKYVKDLENYIFKIATLNKVITAANALLFAPQTAAAAKTAKQAATVAQNIAHLALLKNIALSTNCHWSQRFFLSQIMPYKTNAKVKLRRTTLGTTIIDKKIKILLPSKGLIARKFNNAFFLQGVFKLNSIYATTIKKNIKEVTAIPELMSFAKKVAQLLSRPASGLRP